MTTALINKAVCITLMQRLWGFAPILEKKSKEKPCPVKTAS
jgi:hypothetical protein